MLFLPFYHTFVQTKVIIMLIILVIIMIIKSVSYIISWVDIKAFCGFCFQCWQQYDGPAIKNSRKYDDIRYLLFCLHFVSKFASHLNGQSRQRSQHTHTYVSIEKARKRMFICTVQHLFAEMKCAHVEMKNNF